MGGRKRKVAGINQPVKECRPTRSTKKKRVGLRRNIGNDMCVFLGEFERKGGKQKTLDRTEAQGNPPHFLKAGEKENKKKKNRSRKEKENPQTAASTPKS